MVSLTILAKWQKMENGKKLLDWRVPIITHLMILKHHIFPHAYWIHLDINGRSKRINTVCTLGFVICRQEVTTIRWTQQVFLIHFGGDGE